MNKEDLKDRTKQFALRIMKLSDALPKTTVGRSVSSQLVRCGTSVGANYRAACMGKSKPDFIAKLGIVLEEADEASFWLELIIESHLMARQEIDSLLSEANELTAIFYSSRKSAMNNNQA